MTIPQQLRNLANHIASLDSGSGEAALLREAADENDRLRAALESLTKDPPPTLSREPDTDCEVVLKMRAIARAALSHPKGTET